MPSAYSAHPAPGPCLPSTTNPRATTEAKIAVIGAGPVGVGVVERLAANAPLLTPGQSIEIVLVDPCSPGPGHAARRTTLQRSRPSTA